MRRDLARLPETQDWAYLGLPSSLYCRPPQCQGSLRLSLRGLSRWRARGLAPRPLGSPSTPGPRTWCASTRGVLSATPRH